MEVSESGSADSDSFFAINTMAESQENSSSLDDEVISVKRYPPLFLHIFIDFLDPFALFLCSFSTTSIVGLIFLLFLVLHVLLCKRLRYNFFSITFLISLEIIVSLEIFLLAIFSEDDPAEFESTKIIGISFKDRALTLTSTIIAIALESITISLAKNTSLDLYTQTRKNTFSNPYFTYFIDFLYSYSIAYILSTTISDVGFVIIFYYIYLNFCYAFIGREVICKPLKSIFIAYSLVYSFFQFIMLSYIGSLITPTSGDIWFAFIGTKDAKNACFIFTILLTWSTIIILTSIDDQTSKNISIFCFRHISTILIDALFTIVAVFASFFPNYLTVLYLIIIFFATFCHRQIISRFFFPFLAFVFIMTFLFMAITQYGKFGHPDDNGTEQLYSFIKLFGLYKYEKSNRFTFCWCGFMIFASFGQIGRIKFASRHHSSRKTSFDIHREVNSSGLQEQPSRISLAIRTTAITIEKYFFYFFKIINKFIYYLLMYLSLPSCIVIGIYAGFFKNKWSFQILSFLVMFIVLLFLYFKWPFQILKIVSGLIIISCAFYQSSDSYYCRGRNRCLFFGYFKGVENSGLCPPPNESLIHYCWPVCAVFILSLFLSRDEKCLRTNYPSIIIVLLYFTVSICDLIYAFKYDLSIFTIIYFFIGCFIITFQCLEWNGMRTFMIMLNFIAVSAQLSIYIIIRHDKMRNFFMSHVPDKIIHIYEIKNTGDEEIILLAFMLFLSSIVFHGPQKIKLHNFVKNIIQFVRQINYYLYFDLSSLFLFGLCIANKYPSFIKFLFLVFLTISSISPRFFFKCRILFVIVFTAFIITQFTFHCFIDNNSEKFLDTFRYIGFYFTDKELDNHSKNVSLGWEFGFFIISLLNSPSISTFILPEDFERKTVIQVFRSITACGHYLLQPITKLVMYICASYNETIFSWFLLFIIIYSSIKPRFFYKASPLILFFIHLYMLAQYLLYLGFPDAIITRNWQDPIDLISAKHRKVVGEWFEFFGIYHVRTSSLITTFASSISLAIYLHFYKMQVNYQYRYDSLPPIIKAFVEYVTQNIFKICITFLLVFAALTRKPDGLFLFVIGCICLEGTLLFDSNLISTSYIIQSYIYAISFLRILSRLPVFVDTDKSNLVIRLFDLPLRGSSDSTGYWIVMYALLEFCFHIQRSDLYIELSKKKTKRQAYRFIRERQIKIIEKLDQSILQCKRKQEINILVTKHQENLKQEINRSESNLHLLQSDNEDSMESLQSSDIDFLNDNSISTNTMNNTTITNNNNNLDDEGDGKNNNENNNNINDDNKSVIKIFSDSYDSYESSDFSFLDDDILQIPEKKKWYHRFYFRWVEPQVIRLTRILAISLPINKETGINVLTLESLTILMRRCLSHYERNQEFHLEEREKQFLKALPPSFANHFTSILHLIDYQPLFDQKPIELLLRYLCLFLRNFSLPLLLLVSAIYLFLKPYIYSILIMCYIIFIFSSIDFSEIPNAYRIYFIFVSFILGLQSAANTDLIYERLKSVQSSLANIQSSVSALSLIGIEPGSSPAIEIVLFLSSIYFISKQIDAIHVFSASYYYERLCSLHGFPVEYCYGIMDDPVRNLGMKVPETRSLISTMKNSMSRVWLQTTVHHNFILFINAISCIILVYSWSDWEENSNGVVTSDKIVFSVTVFFIFIIIIDIIIQLSVYFCCLNNLYFILFWIELVWLLYSFSIIFFYIRSNVYSLGKTAQFYIFLRIIQHIIAAHICYIGRTNVSYRSHDFVKDWRIILFSDKFLRYLPYVFEIQSMLLWIGRKTYISFHDFLIVRSMEVQLEIAICKKIEKKNFLKNGKKPKARSRILKGIFILFLFICAFFIPIVFWFNSDSNYVSNSILFAKIQAGISSLPPFYETLGTVRQLSQNEKKIISENPDKRVVSLLTQPQNTLFLIDFPLYSYLPFQLTKTAFDKLIDNAILLNSNLTDLLNSDEDINNKTVISLPSYSYFIKYILYFEHPATISGKIKCEYTVEEPLSLIQLNNTLSVITSFMLANKTSNQFSDSTKRDNLDTIYSQFIDPENYNVIFCDLFFYHLFNVVSTNIISPFDFTGSRFSFLLDRDSFAINISSYSQLSFLNSTSSYKIVVSSAHVLEDLNLQTFYRLSGGDGFTGVYTLLIIVLGISIREIVFKRADNIWINRIHKPLFLYKMIVEINMFKNAKDLKGEKEMCDKFLDVLKRRNEIIIVEMDEIKEKKEKVE